MHFAELVSDRAYVLEKGQIRWTGTMDALSDAERRAARLSERVTGADEASGRGKRTRRRDRPCVAPNKR